MTALRALRTSRSGPPATAVATILGVALPVIAALLVTVAPQAGATSPNTTILPGPSTTAPPPTTAPPTTAPAPAPPPKGVPGVPTGGGPTTVPPAPGAPPPAAPDAGPVVSQVIGDLAQIVAIDSVAQARAAVTDSMQQLAAAQRATDSAAHLSETAQSRQQVADQQLSAAQGRVSGLAVAAYTGETSSVQAAADPSGAGEAPGAGAGPAGLDANLLLSLILDHARQGVSAARQQLQDVARSTSEQGAVLAHARSAQAASQDLVAASQHNLATTLRAATVPGAAVATVAQLPGVVGTLTGTPGPPAGAERTGAGQARAGGAAASLSQPAGSPTILGPAAATAAELTGWFTSRGHAPNITVPIGQLATDYLAAGQQTGVRGDVAFAQSIIETGYFGFPAGGQLVASDNNFAGIGACDSCSHGYSFPDAMTGVTAQEQLLESYASPKPVPSPLIANLGIGGCCTTWTALAGTWASNKAYGIEILNIYKQILDWLIPGRMAAAGLAPVPATTAAVAPLAPPAAAAPHA